MKKLLLFIGLFLLSFSCFSQIYADGKNLNDLGITYCKVSAYNDVVSGRTLIDYGQKSAFLNKTAYIANSKGAPIKFNSTVDLLNYMDINGWEFIESTSTDKGATVNYLFKKKQ